MASDEWWKILKRLDKCEDDIKEIFVGYRKLYAMVNDVIEELLERRLIGTKPVESVENQTPQVSDEENLKTRELAQLYAWGAESCVFPKLLDLFV